MFGGDHSQVDAMVVAGDDAQVGQVTALGRLIEAASRANHGRSMQQAADLATSSGAPISKSMISESARCVETITPKVIRGIAAGYDIPESDVARAMLEDLGFTLTDYSPDAESAIRRDPELSTEARGILLAAITAARSSTGRVAVDEPQDTPRRPFIRRRATGEDPGVSRDKQSG